MKEHPILFSTGMVRAILDGRKTQTRRAVRPQYELIGTCHFSPTGYAEYERYIRGSHWIMGCTCRPVKNFYGWIGDRLWVRETWTAGRIDSPVPIDVISMMNPRETALYYKVAESPQKVFRWRPSIHMPRWASRITLEIVNVRVEHVQEITEQDAKCEGAADVGDKWRGFSYVDGFHFLWDHINAKRGFGWDVNPWVWVIEFKRIEEP